MAANNAIDQPGEDRILRLVQPAGLEQTHAQSRFNGSGHWFDGATDTASRGEVWRFGVPLRAPANGIRPSLSHDAARKAAMLAIRQVDAVGIEVLRDHLARIDVDGLAGLYRGSWLAESSQEFEEMRDLATELVAGSRRLVETRELLRRTPSPANGANGRMASTIGRLSELLGDIEGVLADYHRLEIRLAENVMRARRADCELEAREFRELADQVRAVRAQLDAPEWGLRWLLGRGPSRRERQRLGQRLHRLVEQQTRDKTFIDASELRAWLNTLVDAGLHMPRERWIADGRQARLLFYQLLNVYCLQSALPAERVAVDVILRPDGHDVFDFCAETERYLRHYFSDRRLDNAYLAHPSAITTTAPNADDPLAPVRETMLAEYREHTCSD